VTPRACSPGRAAGSSSEHQAFVAGWTVPEGVGGGCWTVALSDHLTLPDAEAVWGGLPNPRFTVIPDAGLLVYFTHPTIIADLLDRA
jgi:hypothetical protein